MSKILVSLSDDVIFNPGTHTTRYSMERAIKANLKRRLPTFEIDVGRVLVDDDHTLVHTTLTTDIDLNDGRTCHVVAQATASPADLIVRELTFLCGQFTKTVRPAAARRTPEVVYEFVHRLVKIFAHKAC